MLVTPKYAGIDRDTPKLESGQGAEQARVHALRAQAPVPVSWCQCQCCAVLHSPAAPGRGLCYGCLRFKCQPETERTFMGTYEQIQHKRRQWEQEYPGWYLALASEWRDVPYPTREEPMGRQRLRQRFLVRRR